MLEQSIWELKYRPRTIEDCILPAGIKSRFASFVKSRAVPHLLLSGPPGVGKTTVARAMVADLDADLLFINSSINGNIDTLRTEIMDYANGLSYNGERKYVILDEADGLNPQSTQPALRAFMTEFAENCGMILTANYSSRIIDALKSRVDEIKFDIGAAQFKELAFPYIQRLQMILKAEGVEFDLPVLVALTKQHFPDLRKIINVLQGYANEHGKIDTGILANRAEIDPLITALRAKQFSQYEAWLLEHPMDGETLFRALYDARAKICPESSYPALIERIATYQFQHPFVADKLINMLACLASIANGVPFGVTKETNTI